MIRSADFPMAANYLAASPFFTHCAVEIKLTGG
jgi:hypothetical protein